MDEDGIEIKPEPEPSSPVPARRNVDNDNDEDQNEDSEVQIKDMKPDVEVSYKGASPPPYLGITPECHSSWSLTWSCRIRNIVITARPHYRTLPSFGS